MWPEVHMLPTPISCNSTYRLRYWNIPPQYVWRNSGVLQQYLPFTVLKRIYLTGISTVSSISCNSTYRLRYWNLSSTGDSIIRGVISLQQYLPFTVLKPAHTTRYIIKVLEVATVLTVYGIETIVLFWIVTSMIFSLQQYLPFTVLKRH